MGERITRRHGAGGGASRPQLRKVPRNIVFTKPKQEAFLAELARTCNVSASARAIGVVEKTVSGLRRRNPAFQAAWNAALAEGYVTLELKLLEQALLGLGGGDDDAAEDDAGAEGGAGVAVARRRPAAPFDPKLALALLKAHRDTVVAERARSAGTRGDGEDAAVERELAERLELIAERLGRSEGHGSIVTPDSFRGPPGEGATLDALAMVPAARWTPEQVRGDGKVMDPDRDAADRCVPVDGVK